MGLSSLPPVPGLTYNRVAFLTSGTLTLPSNNINKFDCILVSGGGGGGRGGAGQGRAFGGQGTVAYFHDIFCTKGTTLTITIGGGGAGSSTNGTRGSSGTATTITGITGNGAGTSLSSGVARGGSGSNATVPAGMSPQVGFNFTNYNNTSASKLMGKGFGLGLFALSSGTHNSSPANNQPIFGSTNTMQIRDSASNTSYFPGGSGGPVPLLGNYLHASVGGTGVSSVRAGGTSAANTYFAGSGGGSEYGDPVSSGVGGGGGAGGSSNVGGTIGGLGGNGSANSGGGGGAGGTNGVTYNNSGNGGSGGSGFAIIGYWG